MRVVYVGRAVQERKWTLTVPANGVVPSFVDHRATDLVERVAARRPDVVVVFGPERLDRGVAAAFPAATVAYLLDPLAAPEGEDGSPWHVDQILSSRATLQWQAAASAFDAGEYDRVIAADSRTGRRAGAPEVWRSPPLAVDDAVYGRADGPLEGAKPLYIGESTDYREYFLIQAKHQYDLRHYAFGLADERLAQVLRQTTVGVVVSPGRFSTFEPAAPLHLAAGHLLLATPLVPPRGLEEGLDHLTFRGPGDLMHLLFEIDNEPEAFEVVRQRGRVRAEEFRASRVWPRLLHDLLLDLEAFGSPRRAAV
jgi:hypothetical protein